jgi:hypothetical protein
MRYLRIGLLLVVQIACLAVISYADNYNPQPAEGDLVLPMPNGASMIFRPVFIGEGDQPFALREFKLGDATAVSKKFPFKEFPTDAVIGGAFIAKNPHGQPDWLYYIGKYEVTAAQYYAVLDPSKANTEQTPITNISWLEAQAFIEKYNLWLFANAQNVLPRNEDTIGFLRLPTEVEWEFAARGGSAVSPVDFDKKTPYNGQLSKYEWFSGPSSSHDKLKPIGLRAPNPLTLYDMLGNAAEMTTSFYQIEYYQGRLGGFVARGGHFLTAEAELRSALRNEIPFYGKDLKPTRQQTLGFRLVLASPIYASSTTSEKLAQAWENYKKTTRKPPTLPAVAGAPTSVRTDLSLAEANKLLQTMEATLKNGDSEMYKTLEGQIGSLKASFTNLESTVEQGEYDLAYAWAKKAIDDAFLINRDLHRLPPLQEALKAAENLRKSALIDEVNARIQEAQQNIMRGLNRYGSSLEQLAKIRPETAQNGFTRCEAYFQREGLTLELQLSPLVQQHFQQYLQARRLDAEQWKADLQKIFK